MPLGVKTLHRIRGLGVFVDHSHAADVPEFRRYNLIYGFNGSGKTTLSRILRSIELGALSEHLSPDGEFAVSFNDGHSATHETVKGTPNDKIAVFNTDFIDENLRWRDGKASPVYFIGREQARLSLLLDRLNARYANRLKAQVAAEAAKDGAQKQFSTLKRDVARLIAEELNLGRRYVATNLEQDMASLRPDASMLLADDERAARKTLFYSASAGAPIVELSPPPESIVDYLGRVSTHCEGTFSGAVIEALRRHAEMLKWAKDGLDYHTSQALSECLFCGNPLTSERLELLRRSIDDRFERAVQTTQALQSERSARFDELDDWWKAVPAKSAFDASVTQACGEQLVTLERAKEDLRSQMIGVREPLQAKSLTPNLAVEVPSIDLGRASASAEFLRQGQRRVNALIKVHNDKIAGFEGEKTKVGQALKLHHLATADDDYRATATKLAGAEREATTRTLLSQGLAARIEKVQQRLRQHGLAVEPINRLLAAYLGHGDLTLATLEDGYQIQRKGAPIKGPLSEGEKTAIAICYFLSKLDEKGRRRQDVIAIIDDPISSLDTKALNYALTLLRSALVGAAQVFLLTHNLQFMNEIKKWLKPLARKETDSTAALYFLDVRLDDRGRRWAKLCVLPKLLRDYDSEYHYLVALVFAFVNNEGENGHLGYVLPNVMRKVLELFLSFKVPGADGLDSKLKHPIVRDCGLDQARVNALSRLTQVESHGDNLDDLVGFSSMTIEETRDAASALLALMEKLDEHHLQMMKRLCS
jgi:wobble nucleotide-excising tRNase